MTASTGKRTEHTHQWRFFRSGGFDQVRLETGADLVALEHLDQKLWAALNCPVRNITFDERTLAHLDGDKDSSIRVPEVLAAVHWAISLLKDPDELIRSGEGLPLAAINEATPEGRAILASARQILHGLGKEEAAIITAADTADTARIFGQTRFNGDGIIPPEVAEGGSLKGIIEDIMRCVGSVPDRIGEAGVDQELVDRFFAEAQDYVAWYEQANVEHGILTLGESTAAAAQAFQSVRAKVDDYFVRCRLAEYDARAADLLNPSVAGYESLASKVLSPEAMEVGSLPLATVGLNKPLPLREGVNPAWTKSLRALSEQVVTPLLGPRESLSFADWQAIGTRFDAYEAWLAAKRGSAVEALGHARAREILAADNYAAISQLIAKDKALAPEANATQAVDRLVLYHRDLFSFLNNFVSFRDFYTHKGQAVFQAGTLYLDGRGCELCVKVDDVGAHGTLANLSRIYLAYCDCRREGSEEKMTIAAAFTDGDADNLMVGRNGIFYDRKGRDWRATIVKIIEHPISVREAFWSPYRQIGRMISEQVEKVAAAKDKEVRASASGGVAGVAEKAQEGKPAAPPFDVGKFAGIFAAVGLALGAIGTAVASVVTGFMSLNWWQMPLAIGGLMLAISGPSMVSAYLKLRKRNLAPLLDANGWAVNTRAMINIPFGASLTSLAELPPGAKRSLTDPYAERRRPWRTYLVLAAIIAIIATLWHQGHLGRWAEQLKHKAQEAGEAAKQAAQQVAAPVAAPPAAPAPAPSAEKK